jgi:hypothetical protein
MRTRTLGKTGVTTSEHEAQTRDEASCLILRNVAIESLY